MNIEDHQIGDIWLSVGQFVLGYQTLRCIGYNASKRHGTATKNHQGTQTKAPFQLTPQGMLSLDPITYKSIPTKHKSFRYA